MLCTATVKAGKVLPHLLSLLLQTRPSPSRNVVSVVSLERQNKANNGVLFQRGNLNAVPIQSLSSSKDNQKAAKDSTVLLTWQEKIGNLHKFLSHARTSVCILPKQVVFYTHNEKKHFILSLKTIQKEWNKEYRTETAVNIEFTVFRALVRNSCLIRYHSQYAHLHCTNTGQTVKR